MSITREQYVNDLGLEAVPESIFAEHSAWYYTAMQGIGAWFAAPMFIVPFALLVAEETQTLGIGGLVLLVAAALVFRRDVGIFPSQLALVAALAGFALVNIGLADFVDMSENAIQMNVTITGVLSYVCIRDRFYRFLVTLGIVGVWLVMDSGANMNQLVFALSAVCIAVPFVFLPNLRFLRPMGYAMILAGPCALFDLSRLSSLSSASVVAALFGIGTVIFVGKKEFWPKWSVITGTVAVTLLAAATPGAAMGTALALLGHALGNRLLEGLGLILIPVFVAWFYYWLGLSLMVKSLMLMGAGIALLLVRHMVVRRGHA